MFVWYIRGTPRVYEPPLSHAVPAVSAATTIHSVETANIAAQSAENASHSAIKGYGEPQHSPIFERRKVLLVKEIMTSPVQIISPDDSIDKVSSLFSSKKVRHAPVCDNSGKLCGIASERDLLRKMVSLQPEPFVELSPVSAKDFMKHKVLTAAPEAEIRFAARIMFSEKIGCLPVVDKAGRVLGIVTRSDILKIVMNTVPLELWI